MSGFYWGPLPAVPNAAVSGGVAYTLTADAGSYTLTGGTTGLTAQRRIVAASGS
jgi:hypothetical protein